MSDTIQQINNQTAEVASTSTAKNKRKFWKTIFNVVVYAFALAGFGIIGAWAFFQLGFTKNKGSVDENYRYLMSVSEMKGLQDSTLSEVQIQEIWMKQYAKLVAFSKFYPTNARNILIAAQNSNNPQIVDRMIAAASMYTGENKEYEALVKKLENLLKTQPQQESPTVIPWMNTIEWEALKGAIVKDSALLVKAGEITGVEPRMIVSCLVGEQIRLFNSKREMFKKYLGPVKVLSVQSQFSYGVNGIKDFTAAAVERNLKDRSSEFYMGKHYEHILDFETQDHASERYRRLVDYQNHLYSYIYTACILKQTMLQWKRAGYDISEQPDILFTLFNIGFAQSEPKPEPKCGGSHVTVDGKIYTFGVIGFDFYYSGELSRQFPFWEHRFIEDDGVEMSYEEVKAIQNNTSNCSRPVKDAPSKAEQARMAREAEQEFDEDFSNMRTTSATMY